MIERKFSKPRTHEFTNFTEYVFSHGNRDIRFYNAGESGGSAGSAMRRLADDVAALKPTQVAVMFGMNDIWRDCWPRTGCTSNLVQRQQAAVSGFKKATEALVGKIRETCGNPGVIYLTPSPYDQSPAPHSQLPDPEKDWAWRW